MSTSEMLGFANLPNQVHRKSVKKGFDFTLMVVGEPGLGKSTLINCLFRTDLYKDQKKMNGVERNKVDVVSQVRNLNTHTHTHTLALTVHSLLCIHTDG